MLNVRSLMCFVAVALAAAAAVLVGCSSQEVSQPAMGPETSADWETILDKEVVASPSQSTADDRTAALSQISNEQLGSMGEPPKVNVDGQDVFLCCEACEDELRKEPAEYLAKLSSE